MQQQALFNLEYVYNLKTIEDNTRSYVHKKFPKPVEEEDIESYNDFVEDEYKLELASRLKTMAERLEKEVELKTKNKGYL